MVGVGGAAMFVGAALALRLALAPWLTGAQFITFFPAVILATLLFGTAPGLVAVVLSTLASAWVPLTAAPAAQQNYSTVMFDVVALADVAIISALLSSNDALRRLLEKIEHLNEALQTSEDRFRNVVETAPDAMVIADEGDRIVLVNAEAERMFGYRRAEMIGQRVGMLMPEELRGSHAGLLRRFLASPQIRRMGYGQDLLGLRKDGARFPIETNLSVLPGRDSSLVSSAIRDVSQRREAEERQALLIRELNHRVKNTLTIVQSIVAQTLRTAADPKSFATAMTTRLMALSKCLDALTRNDWTGASMRDIATEQLRPYERGGTECFSLTGPDVKLTPNRSVSLGLILGELATNAAKHGALSSGGRVDIGWTIEGGGAGRTLRLLWRESGGPGVGAARRRGFGTQLIERSAKSGLKGSGRLRFAPDGVECEIEFPLLADEA